MTLKHAGQALVAVSTSALFAILGACGVESATPSPATIASAAAIEAHVRFLADDLLEGRDTASRGHELAMLYAVSQFRQMGLAPAGDAGSYLQQVPLLKGNRVQDGARFVYTHDGKSTELKFLVDWLPGVNYNSEASAVSAPLVFVGQAVHAPELGHDDLADIDVKGKIAVLFAGAPAGFGDTQRAVNSSRSEKARLLAARGAVGILTLSEPKDEEKFPWARATRNWQRVGMRLTGPDGKPVDGFPAIKATANLTVDWSRKLFEGAPASFDEALARVEKGESKSFDLPGSVAIEVRSHLEPTRSANVVARLPGADPALAAESVVFSAHLDHIGISAVDPAKPDADRINNGAMDNALGTAILLEVARNMARSTVKPRRSALFVLVTAEEKGLLGAEYFASYPTVPKESIVADVNMDMPTILTELTDVVPFGVEHSSLQHVFERAAKELGLRLSPDPFPEETVFVRSDQYAFVRQGIPSVYIDAGVIAKDPKVDGKALQKEFLEKHYHDPSDQVDLPIFYPTAARLADLNLKIGLMIANDPQRPTWNDGDWLGARFARH